MSIYNFVPPDYLHWDEVDKKYSVFAESELERLCIMSIENGIASEDMTVVMNKIGELRAGGILFDRILKGEVSFSYKDGELVFRA